MKRYRFRDVLTHTGATRSQLIYWTAEGVIQPRIAETTGTGHHRVFSFQNLVDVRLAVILSGYGVTSQTIEWIVRSVRQDSRRANPILCIPGPPPDPNTIWHGTEREFIAEVRNPNMLKGSAMLVIRLGRMIADLEHATGDQW